MGEVVTRRDSCEAYSTDLKPMKKYVLCIVSILLAATVGWAQQAGGSPSEVGDSGAKNRRTSPLTAPGGLIVNVPAPDSTPTVRGNFPCSEPPALLLAVVTKGRVNLRGRANIAGGVVGEVTKGSVLVIEEEDGLGSPWYRVTEVTTGKAGWVHGDVIKIAYRR